MASVYAFTGAAIVTSTIFSLLLFLSIDDDPLMKALFGGLAIIFEAGKFYAWYEFGERRSHGNLFGALNAFGFYLVLAIISIGGSIGGINSATNTAQSHMAVAQSKIDSYNHQIETIDQQIELNNQAAAKYIEMERIANGVARIQAENKKLRAEQQRLAEERDALPPVAQGSVLGLIDSLAKALGTTSAQAQLLLVVFLSILLDLFAAFFVGVIGEEVRFRHYYQRNQMMTIDDISEVYATSSSFYLPSYEQGSPAAQPNVVYDSVVGDTATAAAEATIVVEPTAMAAEAQSQPQQPSREQQIREALASGNITCTKKAVARRFKLTNEEVDQLFIELINEGMLGKKANNHYHWIGPVSA